MERSLQFKGRIRSSEKVSEVVGGSSSFTEMNCLTMLNYMPAENRKHPVTTAQVTVTAMEMMWHTMEMETLSMVCSIDFAFMFENCSRY